MKMEEVLHEVIEEEGTELKQKMEEPKRKMKLYPRSESTDIELQMEIKSQNVNRMYTFRLEKGVNL